MATVASETQGERLIALDVVRGIAVMGIFSVNVVGMAMIETAYFYPPAFGFDSLADKLMWLVNFLLIDGKMRALFSILFGASMLLVIERAVRAGRSGWRTHYARMAALLVLGFAHFMLLWWGDILTHYAAVGMVAVLFHKLKARTLLILSIIGFVLFTAPGVYFFSKEIPEYYESQRPGAPEEMRKKWEERLKELSPDAATLAKDRAKHQTLAAHFTAAFPEKAKDPLELGPLWIETLSLMLLGMAGYKSGFLTGQWDDRRYRRTAVTCLGIGLGAFAILGAIAWTNGFSPPEFFSANQIASPPFRPVAAIGYAALIILLFRHASALRSRVAAVGRTAFTNYIGCTIIGVLLFYGFGGDLYGKLSRFEAWLLVPPVWLVMLAWSKPWLERFQYGPFEWLWRSMARMKLQPMRKHPSVAGPATASA